jgi:AcrR family transcriptional regulator
MAARMADGGAATAGVRGRSGRKPSARDSSDERTVVERILDSAETVLRRHGYAGFTTRRVAEAAGIAPGNLAYHFPTKLELLRALIKRLMTHYSARFLEALQPPGPGVEGLVRWLLDAAVEEQGNALFRELWAMALHDEVVREAVDDCYDQLMAGVEAALLSSYPAANPQHVRELVQLIAVISEGSSVLYGTRHGRLVPYERVVDLAVELIGVIAPELASERTAPGGPLPKTI